jgi:hypothetical protein
LYDFKIFPRDKRFIVRVDLMMIIRSASRAGEEVCLANPEGMQTETNNSKLVKKIILRAGLLVVNESRRIGSSPQFHRLER